MNFVKIKWKAFHAEIPSALIFFSLMGIIIIFLKPDLLKEFMELILMSGFLI